MKLGRIFVHFSRDFLRLVIILLSNAMLFLYQNVTTTCALGLMCDKAILSIDYYDYPVEVKGFRGSQPYIRFVIT